MKTKYYLLALLFTIILSACSAGVPSVTAVSTSTPETQPSSTTAPPEPTQTPPDPTATQQSTFDPAFSPEVIEYAVRLVEQRKSPGIAIGLLTPDGISYLNYGASTWESDQQIDEQTLFEIGSITKVFTALLLAYAVEGEMVALDTPLQELAPEGIVMPAYVDQPVTLQDVATQRSNLPRMPSNFSPANTFNPYIDYPREMMYEYLDGFKMLRPSGTQYEYSNLGFMLLGDLMEQIYAQPYEEIIAEVVTGPLEMNDTVITLTEEQALRFARGHSDVYPVAAWDFALPGAGALRSTTTDMLRFLQANLHPADDRLGAAMQRIQAECFDTDTYFIQVCLGIHTYDRFSKEIYWHNGQTGGYHSFAGFVPEDGTAVVVLVNSNYNIDEFALHLLDPKAPMPAAP